MKCRSNTASLIQLVTPLNRQHVCRKFSLFVTKRYMLLSLLFFFLTGPLAAQTITTISDLLFPSVVSSASSQTITVLASDGGAAVFDLTGTANSVVAVEIAEKSIQATSAGGKQIKIDGFTYGGSLTPAAKGATGTLDAAGNLTNMRIGATASVKNKQESGTYIGTLTLTVVYQ